MKIFRRGIVACWLSWPVLSFAEYEGFSSITEMKQDFPEISIDSVERAELAKKRIAYLKPQIEQEYQQKKSICYNKFFATSCLDRVGASYRKALSELQHLEGEAQAFTRHYAAVEKEKAIASRRATQSNKSSKQQGMNEEYAAKLERSELRQKEDESKRQERMEQSQKNLKAHSNRRKKLMKTQDNLTAQNKEKLNKFEEKKYNAQKKMAERDARMKNKKNKQ